MGSLSCFVCQLPFTDTEARYVKGKPVCTQCQNVVGPGEAAAGTALAPAAAATPGPSPVIPIAVPVVVPLVGSTAPIPDPGFAPAAKPAPKPAPKITMPVGGGKLYFEHSGAWTVGGAFMMTFAGAVSSGVLGFIYTYLHYWNPFIYINALATLATAFAVGFLVGTAARFMDQRNPAASTMIALLSGLFCVYLSWSVWVKISGLSPDFVFDPMALFALIKTAGEKIVWEIKSIKIEGLAVKIFWVLEALTLIFLPGLFAAGAIGNVPYCERCQLWLPEPFTVQKLAPISGNEGFRIQLELGNFSPAASLGFLKGEPSAYTRLEIVTCSGCRSLNVFSAIACTVSKDEEGNVSIDEDIVVDKLLVNAEVRDWLVKGI